MIKVLKLFLKSCCCRRGICNLLVLKNEACIFQVCHRIDEQSIYIKTARVRFG